MTVHPSPYPVRLDGESDPQLNGWLRLAKRAARDPAT